MFKTIFIMFKTVFIMFKTIFIMFKTIFIIAYEPEQLSVRQIHYSGCIHFWRHWGHVTTPPALTLPPPRNFRKVTSPSSCL